MAADDPTGVPIVGPGTPYINPSILVNAPTGIAWTTLPDRNSTPQQQYAAQLDICVRASAQADGWCNQPLRATVDTETLTGPGDFRCQLQPTGVARLLMSRSPVTSVVSGRVSSAGAFPRSWTTIDGDQFEAEQPLIGVYGTTAPSSAGGGGQAILLAPGWVTWGFGRMSSRIEVTYINGWPHASLTTAATAGGTTLVVDDITGWDGAAGVVYDGGEQEFVSVSSVTPTVTDAISGPGTLTLSTGLTYAHNRGVIVSALPASVQQACIYLAVAQALTRGATATAVQAIGGSATGGGPQSSGDYVALAQAELQPYRRVI